mgnify:FL=1|tara:strand:+ start:113992 stop:114978 length:987 start_codon:yes stop_codon:yes gene_type:complete
MSANLKNAFAYALIAALATGLAVGRWLWQGTGNVYSKLDLNVYLPDSDLGWRRTEEGFTWIGLDLVAVLVALTIGVFLSIRFLGERRHLVAKWLVRASRVFAVIAPLLPLYFFLGGAPPSGAKDSLPNTVIEAPTNGILASLPGLPAGRYEVVPHADAAVTAKLKAGGEVFDARFAGGLAGYWEATPSDLSQAMKAEVSVLSEAIETGIDLRNEHALADLKPSEFPRIAFHLGNVVSTEKADAAVAFAAAGEVHLGGKVHGAEVLGTLRAVDAALREKLQLPPGIHVLLQASLSINIKETIIGNDGTFDVDDVPIAVTLILKHSENTL